MKIVVTALAAALAVVSGGAALAATGHGAQEAAVELEQGGKWQTDEALREADDAGTDYGAIASR